MNTPLYLKGTARCERRTATDGRHPLHSPYHMAMGHYPAARCLVALTCLVWTAVSCGGDAADGQPTPDLPRYVGAQAASAIRSHTYVCINVLRRCDFKASEGEKVTIHATCQLADLRYKGNGLWDCGTWSFDERTGLVFRSPK